MYLDLFNILSVTSRTFSDKFYVISSDKTIFSYLRFLLPQNIDFSSILTCVHDQVNCTHWTKWYFTDFPYLLLANQWRPKIWEGPTRRLWRWYVDLFSKKHFPLLEKCAQLTLSPFSLLDTSLHCLVQACPAKIGRCKNWSRSANHPYGHPGNSQHFLNTLNMNSWHLKCQWDHQRWVHSTLGNI